MSDLLSGALQLPLDSYLIFFIQTVQMWKFEKYSAMKTERFAF